MNCNEIDKILDDHEINGMSPSRRSLVDSHLGDCSRCTDIWFAQKILVEQDVSVPPGVLERTLALHGGREAPQRGRHYTRRWLPFGLAAAGALLGVLILVSVGVVTWPKQNGATAGAIEHDASRFLAGTDYEELPAGYSAAAIPGVVEVVVFFMYGCTHCFAFESNLANWIETTPDFVETVRVPVFFNDTARLHARAYYAAEVLGKTHEVHVEFYREIHERGNPLATEAALAEFFSRFGVGGQEFSAALYSPLVETNVSYADELSSRPFVVGTPSMVINGKYLIKPTLAGTFENMIEIVDWLVATEVDQAL